jgi:hypothetical protein
MLKQMDLSNIYVHDGKLLRVIEDTATDTLAMEVELPTSDSSDDLVPRLLIFENVYSYQVFEGPFVGCPVLLDITVVGQQELYGRVRHRVRIETNAGYRELYCETVKVCERSTSPA